MRLKASSAKWRPFCLGLNVLTPGATLKQDYLFTLDIIVISLQILVSTIRQRDCHFIESNSSTALPINIFYILLESVNPESAYTSKITYQHLYNMLIYNLHVY